MDPLFTPHRPPGSAFVPTGDVRYVQLPLLDLDVMVDMPARVHLRTASGTIRTLGLGSVEAADLRCATAMRRPRAGVTASHLPGEWWSSTTGDLVIYESQLELTRVQFADFSPDVLWILGQPCTIEARVSGCLRRQTLDLALFHRDSTVTLVNVKPAERLIPLPDNEKRRASVAWPAAVCAARGWRYEVWCGAPGVEVNNIRTLSAARVVERIDSETLGRARALHRNGMTLAELEQAAGGWMRARPAVLHLLWRGELRCDLTKPLGGMSMLFGSSERAGAR